MSTGRSHVDKKNGHAEVHLMLHTGQDIVRAGMVSDNRNSSTAICTGGGGCQTLHVTFGRQALPACSASDHAPGVISTFMEVALQDGKVPGRDIRLLQGPQRPVGKHAQSERITIVHALQSHFTLR